MFATLPTELLPHILALFTGTPCLVALFDEQDLLRWADIDPAATHYTT